MIILLPGESLLSLLLFLVLLYNCKIHTQNSKMFSITTNNVNHVIDHHCCSASNHRRSRQRRCDRSAPSQTKWYFSEIHKTHTHMHAHTISET